MAADAWARGVRDLDGGLRGERPSGPAAPRRGDHRGGAASRRPTPPGGSRSTCCARSTSRTPTPTWPCRGLLRGPRTVRPGRRVRHRAGLRHPAWPRQLRRSARGMRGPAARASRPAGPRRAAPRRPPAARDAGARRMPRWPRPSSWPAPWSARAGGLRQRRAAPGRAPATWTTGWRASRRRRRGPGRPPRGRALPPALGRLRVPRRARRRAATRRGAARRRQRPAQVTLVARPGRATRDELLAAGRAAGPWSPYAAVLARRRPGRAGRGPRGPRRRAGRGQPARRAGPRRGAVDGARRRAGSTCAPARAARPRCSPPSRAARGARLLAAERAPHRADLVAQRARRRPAPHVVVDARTAPAPAVRPARSTACCVDAPCTGLGALRRRPEARWRRQPEDVADLAPLQRAAARRARWTPSGPAASSPTSTCSPHLAETRRGRRACCAQRPDVERLDARPLLPGVPDARRRARTYSCGRTGTAPTRCSWPCCAAPRLGDRG